MKLHTLSIKSLRAASLLWAAALSSLLMFSSCFEDKGQNNNDDDGSSTETNEQITEIPADSARSASAGLLNTGIAGADTLSQEALQKLEAERKAQEQAKKTAEQDYKLEDLMVRTDDLRGKYDELAKESESNLQTRTKMQQDIDSNGTVTLLAIALAIIALIVAVIAMLRCSALQKQLRDEQGDSPKPFGNTPPSAPVSRMDINNLQRTLNEIQLKVANQIRAIDDKVNKLYFSQARNTINDPVKPDCHPTNPGLPGKKSETGYFGFPVPVSNPYFQKLMTRKDGDALFSAQIDGKKATFAPIDSRQTFGTLVSNNTLRAAIDFSGDAKNATTMTLEKSGEAELRGDYWYITKKAKVQLR